MKLRVRNFMKELGLRECGDMIYGIVDGYLVSVSDRDGVSTLFVDILLSGAEDIQREKIRNFIESNTSQYSILRAEVKGTGVKVYFDGSSSGFSKLKDFLFFFVRHLATLGIPGASVCSNCGKPISSIAIVNINGSLHTCDTDCAKMLAARADASADNKRKRRSRFIPGTIGALFGAVLAIVPYVFLSRADIFALWCGLLIALFVKGGYEVFGGRPSIGKGVVVPLLSLLSSAVCVFLSYCFSLLRIWNDSGYRFEFIEAFNEVKTDILTGGALQLQFLKDTGIVFGFAVLGILLLVRFRKKEDPRRVYILG